MTHGMDEPRYSIAEAARLAAKSVSTLRNQIGEGVLTLAQSDRNSVPGGTRLLTARRVLQIVIAAQLEAMWVPPKRAAQWAFTFTDTGDGEGDEGATPDNAGLARLPGSLFSGSYTWLVAHPGQDIARIVAVGPNASAHLVNIGSAGVAGPMIVLPLDRIVAELRDALGIQDNG